MISYFFNKQRKLHWILAITFVLFTLLISEHHIDSNTQHHETHHCQLFNSIHSGVAGYIISPPIILQPIIKVASAVIEIRFRSLTVFQSRAPPYSNELTLATSFITYKAKITGGSYADS